MHSDHPDEAEYRRRYGRMEIGELVDAWDEPMAEEARAPLLAELEDRGYRIKALPAPPLHDGGSGYEPPDDTEEARTKVEVAALVILSMAVLQGIAALVFLFLPATRPAGLGALDAGATLGIAAVFLLLHKWARRSPRPAIATALVLFLGLHGLNALVDPSTLLRGGVFKVLIVLALAGGLLNTGTAERVEEAGGARPSG